MLVGVYRHTLEEKILKNLIKSKVFGKIAHEKCGANNLETSKKALIYKASFYIPMHPACICKKSSY